MKTREIPPRFLVVRFTAIIENLFVHAAWLLDLADRVSLCWWALSNRARRGGGGLIPFIRLAAPDRRTSFLLPRRGSRLQGREATRARQPRAPRAAATSSLALRTAARAPPPQPRPTNGIFVAMTVIVRTLAESGSDAM